MFSGVAPALNARRTSSKRTRLLPTRRTPGGSSRSGTITVKGSKSSVVIGSTLLIKKDYRGKEVSLSLHHTRSVPRVEEIAHSIHSSAVDSLEIPSIPGRPTAIDGQ